MKTILEENPESLIYRFLALQFEKPTRGDFASSCIQDLAELEISLTMEEIKKITKYQFKKLIKMSIQKKALQYLIAKRGSKGIEIHYHELKMAEYLQPNEEEITITDQRNIFAIRNRMVEIPNNYRSNKDEHKCVCGKNETTEHIYNCEQLNSDDQYNNIHFEEIFKDNIEKQVEISRIFFKNLQSREKHLIVGNISHVIQRDPLCSVMG